MPDAPVRVWVPGCATGEEAYSIAMLLLERIAATAQGLPDPDLRHRCRRRRPRGRARRGIYPDEHRGRLSRRAAGPLLHRGRMPTTGRSASELRETVRLRAAEPASATPVLQARPGQLPQPADLPRAGGAAEAAALLHFALNEGGYLFLGPSETIGRQTDLFEPVSKKWRIYRRRMRRPPTRAPAFRFAGAADAPAAARAGQPARRPARAWRELAQQAPAGRALLWPAW